MWRKFLLIIFFVIVSYFVYDSLHDSYAYLYQSDSQYKLFYNDDIDVLNDNIIRYVDDIDDIIMVNATYEDSSILVENYSFLTNFSIKYILLHEELFSDKIIIGDNASYIDMFGNIKNTNKYIDLESIYYVSEWFFGVNSYYIENNDNYILLSDMSMAIFNNKIKDVKSYIDGDIIKSFIIYDDGSKYLWTFYIKNNVLKIKNVEVSV